MTAIDRRLCTYTVWRTAAWLLINSTSLSCCYRCVVLMSGSEATVSGRLSLTRRRRKSCDRTVGTESSRLASTLTAHARSTTTSVYSSSSANQQHCNNSTQRMYRVLSIARYVRGQSLQRYYVRLVWICSTIVEEVILGTANHYLNQTKPSQTY